MNLRREAMRRMDAHAARVEAAKEKLAAAVVSLTLVAFGMALGMIAAWVIN